MADKARQTQTRQTQTSQTIPLYNQDSSEKNTEESDTQGGTRKITETDTKTDTCFNRFSARHFGCEVSVVARKSDSR